MTTQVRPDHSAPGPRGVLPDLPGSVAGRHGLVRHFGLEPADPETWLFLEDGRAWSGMEAIIRIGTCLGGIGRIAPAMRVLPRSGREWLYRRIAHNRFRFGRTDMCALADPELRRRLMI